MQSRLPLIVALVALVAIGLALVAGAPAVRAQGVTPAAGAPPEPKGEVVGILSFATTDLSAAAESKFEETIEEGLASLGLQVAPRKRLSALLSGSSWIEGCFFGACLSEVFRITQVRLVLVAKIRSFGPSYAIVLTLVDTRTGLPTSQVAQRCEVCTVDEAASQITLGVIELATGTGDASVANPTAGPTGISEPVDHVAELARLAEVSEIRRRSVRRVGIFYTSVAVVAGAAAAYFIVTDEDRELGKMLAVGAGTSAVAGATMFVLSRKF